MKIFKDRFLILSLVLGLFIRLILTPVTGFKFDVDTWFAWADRLNSVEFSNFYSDQIWTGYPPGFLYILALLGFIKNLFHIDSNLFYIILKFPSILAEIITAIFIYYIIPKKLINWRKIGLMFTILNPAFIFNSSIFGQFDGLFSLTLLTSIYFLTQKKIVFASTFAGLSFLLKPQAVLLLPVISFYLLKNFSVKSIFKVVLPAMLLIFFLFFPFFKDNPLSRPVSLVYNLMVYYPYTSIFAYNFWGIFGFWLPDNHPWNNLTYQKWGYILFAGYWLTITYLFLKKKLSLYALTALASLSFYFLPTRIHERYLYPAIPFLILTATILKSKFLLILTAGLSLIHFLNLYYVYVYYNEFYLKLPKVLYNPFLYSFLDTQGKVLSLVSTGIFVLISIVILKSNYESKKT